MNLLDKICWLWHHPVYKPTDKIHEKILIQELKQLRRLLMATKQEVLDAIAAEKEQVLTAVTALNQQIQDLQAQLAAGDPITSADLDEIAAAVNDIFVPA